MKPKDNFSTRSSTYAKFRPTYPQALYDYLLSQTVGRERVWDCGTGNGQAAQVLAQYFLEVEATDLSSQQLSQVSPAPNINYQVARAEEPPFPDNHFDLITVAVALHWFHHKRFYPEVKRVARPGALFAAWAYETPQISEQITRLFWEFHDETLGWTYWDPERVHVIANYSTLDFPFDELQTPRFKIELEWTRECFEGYLNSWSSVNHYIRKNGVNPVQALMNKLEPYWEKDEIKKVVFPVFMRAARVI
ncbi:class I SAM-dependent methyltransferase [Pseudomonadota bacterium]